MIILFVFCTQKNHELIIGLTELQERRKASTEPFGYYSAEVPTILSQQGHANICREQAGGYQYPLYAAAPAPVVQPVMFIDGDISASDAEKLAAVIREWDGTLAPVAPDDSTCKYCGGTGYFRWQQSENMCPCPCVGCDLSAAPLQEVKKTTVAKEIATGARLTDHRFKI